MKIPSSPISLEPSHNTVLPNIDNEFGALIPIFPAALSGDENGLFLSSLYENTCQERSPNVYSLEPLLHKAIVLSGHHSLYVTKPYLANSTVSTLNKSFTSGVSSAVPSINSLYCS